MVFLAYKSRDPFSADQKPRAHGHVRRSGSCRGEKEGSCAMDTPFRLSPLKCSYLRYHIQSRPYAMNFVKHDEPFSLV